MYGIHFGCTKFIKCFLNYKLVDAGGGKIEIMLVFSRLSATETAVYVSAIRTYT